MVYWTCLQDTEASVSDLQMMVLMLTLVPAGLAKAYAPHLERIIWALRCPPDSPNYKCPPPSDRRSALSGIFRRRP